MQKRLDWAYMWAGFDLRRVMFTDESCFKIGEGSVQRVIRGVGEEYWPQHIQIKFRHGKAIHVWGAIMYGVKLPLIKFNLAKARTVNKVKLAAETITSVKYMEQILWGPMQDYVNQARDRGVDVKVVEDGASVHFKGQAKTMRDMLDIPNHPHPPSLPDLNPIEGCWNIVKGKLRRMQPRPTSEEGLWKEVQRIWAEIPQERIDRMIDSMNERRTNVIGVKGGSTKW
jgi:transposase